MYSNSGMDCKKHKTFHFKLHWCNVMAASLVTAVDVLRIANMQKLQKVFRICYCVKYNWAMSILLYTTSGSTNYTGESNIHCNTDLSGTKSKSFFTIQYREYWSGKQEN